eukprot:TRINITY_DN1407_c0_g1_i1.p1 TRINITY_DN1407_c0_g1~~TRINITY_DN1407_c0_g1_i1.p1  ORF type:complete len:166 (+),score=34.67 TRINITY_DN1407_c0_g1_i1:90-587(+)
MNFTGSGASKNNDLESQDTQATCCQKLWNVIAVGGYGVAWSFMMYHFYHPVVAPAVFFAVTAGWLVITGILMYCVHVKGMTFGGVDQRFFDIFNIPHFLFGVVMGMSGLALVFVVGAAIVWELVEITTTGFGENESPINRFGDITMATVAWFLVRGVIAHSFLWY